MKLLILITIASISLSKELNACYKAYFFIFPVAKSCITYRIEGNLMKISSEIKTVGVGSIAHKVHNRGGAIIKLDSLEPKHFFFKQKEGRYRRDMNYMFNINKNKIDMHVIKYKGTTENIEREYKKSLTYDGYNDPFTASIKLYLEAGSKKKGYIFLFYDGRKYKIPYFLIGEEEVEGRKTWYIEVEPNIKTGGLLKPEGKWYLWIDKEMKIPIKMELEFIIGSTLVKLTEIKGNKLLFRSIQQK